MNFGPECGWSAGMICKKCEVSLLSNFSNNVMVLPLPSSSRVLMGWLGNWVIGDQLAIALYLEKMI